jgi:hypothetical protein
MRQDNMTTNDDTKCTDLKNSIEEHDITTPSDEYASHGTRSYQLHSKLDNLSIGLNLYVPDTDQYCFPNSNNTQSL